MMRGLRQPILRATKKSALRQVAPWFDSAGPPPSGGDPYFANVALLLGFEGSDGSTTFVDESPNPKTVTANGNAQIDTAQSKFGSGSLLLDGSGDYLSIGNNADFGFGTADFTAELFLRRAAGTSGDAPMLDFRTSGSTNGMLYLTPTTRLLTYYNGSVFGGSGSAPAVDTWDHIAYARESGTLRAFLNGVQQWSPAMAGDFTTARPLSIGGNFAASSFIQGHMDELRITKGVARYTANFAPPTSAFPRF